MPLLTPPRLLWPPGGKNASLPGDEDTQAFVAIVAACHDAAALDDVVAGLVLS